MSIKIAIRFAFLAAAAVTLSGCPTGTSVVPAMKQLSAETQVLLAKQGMRAESPIFIRIFKEDSQLEIWKQKDDGRFYHFKTYPICAWSGTLGPKVVVGDKQAPEGFYTITPGQMNPNSQYYLAFNLGFPNAYDKANGRTGDSLMVHGDCRSAGCFAMTDALIEEIYILARESFQGGQTQFQVNAFPFRMTTQNMARHRGDKWYSFWMTLKEGYDSFEKSRIPPKIAVCSKHYLVNASFFGQTATPDPAGECPAYRKVQPEPFNPFTEGPIQAKANGVPGQNTRVASYETQASPAAAAQIVNTVSSQPSRNAAYGQTAASAQPMHAQPAGQTYANASAAQVSGQPSLRTGQPATSPEQRQANLAPPRDQQQQTQPVQVRVPQAQPAQARPQPAQTAPAQQKTAPAVADKGPEDTSGEDTAASETQPVVTRGLHNVMESTKGDMIVPRKPAPAPAQSEYGYGQTTTAGTTGTEPAR